MQYIPSSPIPLVSRQPGQGKGIIDLSKGPVKTSGRNFHEMFHVEQQGTQNRLFHVEQRTRKPSGTKNYSEKQPERREGTLRRGWKEHGNPETPPEESQVMKILLRGNPKTGPNQHRSVAPLGKTGQ